MVDRATQREQAAFAAGVHAHERDEALYRSDVGARVRAGGPVRVLRRSQHEVEPEWSNDDRAKLSLAREARDARRTLSARVRAWPGTFARTELWSRLQKVEERARALSARGLWQQALVEFRQGIGPLLRAQPKPRDSEPVGVGALGVGSADECPACGGASLGCLACRGRRALEDFQILLRRTWVALRSGQVDESNRMLARAKQAVHALEPADAPKAQRELEGARAAVADVVRVHDEQDARPGVSDSPSCPADCPSCPACRGRRALEDFWGVVRRVRRELAAGEVDEANRVLPLAGRAIHALDPGDVPAAQVALAGARAAVADGIAEKDARAGRGHVRMGSRDGGVRDVGRAAVRDGGRCA